jgi:predicted Na+-dependent transporter
VRIANLALVIALASGLAVNWQIITTLFGSWVLVAALVIVVIALGLGLLLGLLLGRRDNATRTTTGLLSGMRFSSLGLIIIATQLDGDSIYLGPALCFALIDLLIPLAVAAVLGHRADRDMATIRARLGHLLHLFTARMLAYCSVRNLANGEVTPMGSDVEGPLAEAR